MFDVTALAVMKVVVAICIGAHTSRKIPDAESTLRAFGFIIANILLPSLTFYFTATSVTMDLLSRCFVLILFAVFLIGLGLVSAMMASRFLFPVRRTGIPNELRDSVRYELLFHDAEDRNVGNGTQPHQHNKRELQPFVCVVVGGTLEEQSVGAEEILPFLGPPHVEYEEQPFYHYATILACSMQNSVTLPLSLLQSFAASLPWIDLAVGASYIFVYSIVVSAFLWSIGPMLVERAKRETDKRRKIRELIETHWWLQGCCDVATQTEVCRGNSRMTSPSFSEEKTLPHPSMRDDAAVEGTVAGTGVEDAVLDTAATHAVGAEEQNNIQTVLSSGFLAETPATCNVFAYDWRDHGFIRFMYEREFEEKRLKEEGSYSLRGVLRGIKNVIVQMMRTPSFVSVVVGVVVGVTPPLRWLMLEGPLSVFTESIALLSHGSIPSSLLLLGSNLVGTSTGARVVQEVRFREAGQNTEFPLDDKSVDPKHASIYNIRHKAIEFDRHASPTFPSFRKQQRQRQGHMFMATGGDSVAVFPNGASHISERDGDGASGGGLLGSVCEVFSLRGVRKSFVFGVIIIRLLFIPAIGFSLALLLRMAAPSFFEGADQHDMLLFVLLGELSAPTAINCTILFNTREYMPDVWSKMLLYVYITCIATLLMWCTLSLYIVG